ncbi:MAG: hypothetical protein JWL85_128 [Candidatus Saccharibacteria bacterium]|nr:hypothetical protein [Candidatus Saccharibacteria bacterium]
MGLREALEDIDPEALKRAAVSTIELINAPEAKKEGAAGLYRRAEEEFPSFAGAVRDIRVVMIDPDGSGSHSAERYVGIGVTFLALVLTELARNEAADEQTPPDAPTA